MSDSVRPHRRQPTRLPRPWNSPDKNTGVGCHFLLQCMKVKSEVAQSCPTPSDAMDHSLSGSSIQGIFQARVLEWGAIAFSGCRHRAGHLNYLKSLLYIHPQTLLLELYSDDMNKEWRGVEFPNKNGDSLHQTEFFYAE